MAISFIASSEGGGVNAVSPAEPTGASEGDFLHLLVMVDTERSPTVSGDWTLIQEQVIGTTARLSHWYCFRGATAPDYDVDARLSKAQAVVSAFRGVDPAVPFDGLVGLSNGSSSDTTYPAMTSAGGGRLAVRVRGVEERNVTETVAGGWTNRIAQGYRFSFGGEAFAQVSTKDISSAVTEAPFSVANGGSRPWAAGGFYLIEDGGRPKVWDGSEWEAKPLKVWSGSAWETKPLKRWDGSAWVLV